MKKFLSLCLVAVLYCGMSDAAFANNSIDGYWQTVDDKTLAPKGIIQIYTVNNVTFGKVMGGYPVNGVVPHDICAKCPAPFTNQKVTGMQILWGFSYDAQSQEFKGGHILDPDSGHIYDASLMPLDQGASLEVHGYIGIPLLGRSQTWHRLTPAEFKSLIAQYPQP